MPRKDWWYVTTWVDPKAQIQAISDDYKNHRGTPMFLSYYSRTVLLRPVLQDYEEDLHSLIQENTCTCGLRLRKSDNLLAIIESKHHRNHKTLEPDPNPKFRGLVGRRITMPLMPMDWRHEVDVLWDEVIQ
jgi:hypothetical protein